MSHARPTLGAEVNSRSVGPLLLGPQHVAWAILAASTGIAVRGRRTTRRRRPGRVAFAGPARIQNRCGCGGRAAQSRHKEETQQSTPRRRPRRPGRRNARSVRKMETHGRKLPQCFGPAGLGGRFGRDRAAGVFGRFGRRGPLCRGNGPKNGRSGGEAELWLRCYAAAVGSLSAALLNGRPLGGRRCGRRRRPRGFSTRGRSTGRRRRKLAELRRRAQEFAA